MTAIDDKRLNEMVAGMKLYADMPYGVKINEFSAKDLYSAMVELRELRATGRWVPVSERLPEEDKRVFVCGDYGGYKGVFISAYLGGSNWSGDIKVTHWMPLLPLPVSEVTNA